MKHILFVMLLVAVVFLFGCIVRQVPVACTADAKLCPDGSAVGRVPPNCEFAECPPAPVCTYDNPDRQYIMNNTEDCKVIMFLCVQGKTPFTDDCGCGCEVKEMVAVNCTAEQRAADICTMEYLPVCGWWDPARIQCIKYPCAATYGNKCGACQDDKVLYWTEGECPT